MKYGLNLYSIRSLIGTEESFLQTALALKEMGYEYAQYSGAAFDPERIARVSKQAELPIVLTHVGYNSIINDTEKLMEQHDLFGCKNIGLGCMPIESLKNREEMYQIVENLEKAAIKMEENGFHFFYHHHHFELMREGEETFLDYMMKNAPHVNFTADTYWLQYGGVSIVEYLNKMKGRIACVHLKDYRVDFGMKGDWKDPGTRFAPVGEGNINFRDVIPAMSKNGAEYFLVEQDNAVEAEEPLEEVRRSIQNLKKMTF
ncbi:MAG: sugar phosphate isomerase/epimerase [Clostridia bacterium]|nr:sugar phosphate isomerase/epimerase [Clostridia bacterium]